MTLLQKLFTNANLPTDFFNERARACEAWWQAEMIALACQPSTGE